MGNFVHKNITCQFSNGYHLWKHPEVTPHPLEAPKNDPLEGFSRPRKVRTMRHTQEELESAKIPLKNRDYCAHELLKFKACRKDKWPFPVFCKPEKHAYLNCMYEDFVLRMKEYERERRLMVREHRRE
ncbi:PREDICTED: NADH dehydrogenase [ubiquinone] 1 beta subcomplex subunit 7-like [Nicrophorus vespilloides]|uniref:NADH dehydrogenase [ubiquinone] 1 beta subcomplex subunit 7 n=1 Tax=Nicrophorus vespilloides TaxID=110193 RepID=A0ABM1NDB7_NICVS|nr:PREDICTED: NADH dehydrogenase [ubiquinone] 1 beta subcomplex subunit 7-like [Nicrophorus vespilloides]